MQAAYVSPGVSTRGAGAFRAQSLEEKWKPQWVCILPKSRDGDLSPKRHKEPACPSIDKGVILV